MGKVGIEGWWHAWFPCKWMGECRERKGDDGYGSQVIWACMEMGMKVVMHVETMHVDQGMGMKVVMHGRAWPCKGEKNELEGHLKENR